MRETAVERISFFVHFSMLYLWSINIMFSKEQKAMAIVILRSLPFTFSLQYALPTYLLTVFYQSSAKLAIWSTFSKVRSQMNIIAL